VTAARGRRRLALSVLLLSAWWLGGCVYFPSVREVGGVRFKPEKGRLVRDGDDAVFYVELASTGKYGDTLLGASMPVARRARLVSPAGPVDRLEVPGETVFVLGPGGPRVVFSELTRPLTPGEVVIVTLNFVKYGNLGVISIVE
jgi:copper(I)-binding protein